MGLYFSDPLFTQVLAGILNIDLATLGSGGQLTVALNGGDDTWASIQTTDLGVGSLNGMELGRFDPDGDSDLIVQGSDAISVFDNDGNAQFSLSQSTSWIRQPSS